MPAPIMPSVARPAPICLAASSSMSSLVLEVVVDF
jgi:hypothetical protein